MASNAYLSSRYITKDWPQKLWPLRTGQIYVPLKMGTDPGKCPLCNQTTSRLVEHLISDCPRSHHHLVSLAKSLQGLFLRAASASSIPASDKLKLLDHLSSPGLYSQNFNVFSWRKSIPFISPFGSIDRELSNLLEDFPLRESHSLIFSLQEAVACSANQILRRYSKTIGAYHGSSLSQL